MLALTVVDGLTTTVTVISEEGSLLADLNIVGKGVARCRPDDLFVASTGERIALGRAIADYGCQVAEAGSRESVSNEDVERVTTALAMAVLEGLPQAPKTPQEPDYESMAAAAFADAQAEAVGGRCGNPNCACAV